MYNISYNCIIGVKIRYFQGQTVISQNFIKNLTKITKFRIFIV